MKSLNIEMPLIVDQNIDPDELIEIYTLGRFSIKTGRNPELAVRRKSKPLDLLKAVIANGGRQVSCEKIMNSLWPHSEGDTARRNFDTTLHRLRKLLQNDDAITLSNGLLTMDSNHVWVDAWAFDRLAGQVLKQARQENIDANELIQKQRELLEYYRGPFLGQEFERPWSLGYRERLHQRMVRALNQLGNYWIKQNMWDAAVACFEFGINTDPLVEGFYQKLMHLHLKLSQHADAANTYQRCRRALAFNLGVTPSPDTVALYKQCT